MTYSYYVSGFINTQERNFMISAMNIFNYDSSLSTIAILDTIIDRSTRLLAEFNSINWSMNNGGLVGGFISISKSSAEYWRAFLIQTSNPSSPNGFWKWALKVIRGATAPQLDAAGYLYGWGKAWAIDELDQPKQRIWAGVEMAASTSGIGAILK
jgi:hypothetical protein